jgi:hypothetical protein
MEADIGNPIDFNKEDHIQDSEPDQDHDYYQHQQQAPNPMMMMPPPMYQSQQPKVDFFANIDKTTWIIGFIVFILGFFMGKTMQPIILRPG